MVKQPTAEQSEFQMSSEDFPALPGTQLANDGSMVVNNLSGLVDQTENNKSGASASGLGANVSVGGIDMPTDSMTAALNEKAFQRGVQTSPDGELLHFGVVGTQFHNN